MHWIGRRLILLLMIRTVSAEKLAKRVAVLGSGISGATCANALAEAGMEVTVFESGRGVGGRTSTRRSRKEGGFAYDHGCQYIAPPQTESFRTALEGWITADCVREWTGSFMEYASPASPAAATSSPTVSSGLRYVGYPAMNSISKHLLAHGNITTILQTRACAKKTSVPGDPSWHLTAHEDGRYLGSFHYLVSSDRTSANRADLREAPIPDYKSITAGITSVPSLVLMLALSTSIEGLPDSMLFPPAGEFGSLGWAARDTSKPGRARTDGKECWVVHSSPEAARSLLDSVAREEAALGKGDSSFEDTRERVREAAHDLLLRDFQAAVVRLTPTAELPKVEESVGHRWSAAFPEGGPAHHDALTEALYEEGFVACGDYCSAYPGKVEGAFLSGFAAAGAVVEHASRCTD